METGGSIGGFLAKVVFFGKRRRLRPHGSPSLSFGGLAHLVCKNKRPRRLNSANREYGVAISREILL